MFKQLAIVFISAFLFVSPAFAAGTEVFSQPADGSGTVLLSHESDGSTQYYFDDFTFPAATDINQINWTGTYKYGNSYPWYPVSDFKVEIFSTTYPSDEPYIAGAPLKKIDFESGIGNAGETDLGGGLYEYSLTLGTPFHADAGIKYWIQIMAMQQSTGDWGLVKASGGNSQAFAGVSGNSSLVYGKTDKDMAFSLFGDVLAPAVPEFGLITGLFTLAASAGSWAFLRKKV